MWWILVILGVACIIVGYSIAVAEYPKKKINDR